MFIKKQEDYIDYLDMDNEREKMYSEALKHGKLNQYKDTITYHTEWYIAQTEI